MCNPTLSAVKYKYDDRLNVFQDQKTWRFHIELIDRYGEIYGSYYRKGEFWVDEVFVCPWCSHATLLKERKDIEKEGEWKGTKFYCKYCYNDWVIEPGRVAMIVREYDDDGEKVIKEYT